MRVATFTASRADYWLLQPLLSEFQSRAEHCVLVLASGAHLSPEYGSTVDYVRDDGLFNVVAIPSLSATDDRLGAAASHALVTQAVAQMLSLEARPDLFVVLGDRFETHAAVTAAYLIGIPIAHFHGGEVIHGVFDDGFRHSISKMASVHFVANKDFAYRLIRMGEDPLRVHPVGAIGNAYLDWYVSHDEQVWPLLQDQGVKEGCVVVAVHPETTGLGADVARAVAKAMLGWNTEQYVIIDSNADPGGRAVRAILWDAVHMHSMPMDHVHLTGLSRHEFVSLLRHSRMLLGNSSAGLIEAPLLGVPSVDVGTRQEGRPRACSVYHAPADGTAVLNAMRKTLDYLRGIPAPDSKYPPADVPAIVDIIEREYSSIVKHKRFYDTV